ncbi:hypothetical protein [Amycolatopsis sp. FDAARGOS 1241]|uniref:hypothetical protein n=1 Tax=Amycolatopsis sp. FDAARGOS 1241 TaxID=2778070 RepID=UPI00194F559D|nr:hypothetical protein [Amycolatopsis sp. FDAARGOS 1241]QRP45982.1 hypothetical protein I6J71_44160 [Amycolatopsis sp. FDAARGOS 1241]
MDSGSSGAAGGIGDPDDDHPNHVGDAVVSGVRSVLNKLGPAGKKAADQLPKKKDE